jgi:hypothetical protein
MKTKTNKNAAPLPVGSGDLLGHVPETMESLIRRRTLLENEVAILELEQRKLELTACKGGRLQPRR